MKVIAALRTLMLVSLLTACAPARPAPPDTSGIAYTQRLGQSLPLATRFVDQNGHDVTLRDVVANRPTVLALGYFACPALCGLIRQTMFEALEQTGLRAGTDYQLAFISIDPAETPADAGRAMRSDLAAYPSDTGDSGWHFLTGRPDAIGGIERAVGYHSRYDASLKQFIHPAGLVLISPHGLVSGYLLGVGYRPGDLRAGIVRARDGGIAKAALPVLLLCFHYDASTGRYSLAILKLLRLAGGVTVLTILALLMLLRRKASKVGALPQAPPKARLWKPFT